VLALLATGRTQTEIARDLFVAPGTVKAHVNNIYRKLGARNRTEALARARELGLIG
jgi:DNA-binding NarL/FixJ family response regulator